MSNINKPREYYKYLLNLEFKGSVGDFYIFRCINKYNKKLKRIEKSDFYMVYSLKRKDVLFKFKLGNLDSIFDLLTHSEKIKSLEEVIIFGGCKIQNLIIERDKSEDYCLRITNEHDMYNGNFILSKCSAYVNLREADSLFSREYSYKQILI